MKFHQWVFKILKKQNNARTDARTDGQRENSIPPLKLRFGGGYNNFIGIKSSDRIVTIHVDQILASSNRRQSSKGIILQVYLIVIFYVLIKATCINIQNVQGTRIICYPSVPRVHQTLHMPIHTALMYTKVEH